MKLINNSNFNLPFLKISGNFGLWLLLMGFSINAYAQIHVSDNTVLSVKKGTVLYIADKATDDSSTRNHKEKAKIYVTQNTQLTNFINDSLVEIVYLKNENQPKKSKQITQQKRTKTPLQPPIVKKDTQPERKSVLYFTSIPKTPSALFYAGKTTKAALVQSGNFVVKLFPPKKTKNNTIHTFFLNDAQPIRTAFTDVYLQHQIHLENQITRPPPCHSVRV